MSDLIHHYTQIDISSYSIKKNYLESGVVQANIYTYGCMRCCHTHTRATFFSSSFIFELVQETELEFETGLATSGHH